MSDPFEGILGQDHMIEYLRAALDAGQVTHAYLLCGAAECGVDDIALRFAAAIIAGEDEGAFDLVMRHSHPDLHEIQPASAKGYLVEQVREVVHDAGLAPVRAARKVYIVSRAQSLFDAPANALLKTLEEPPADVVIIMVASNEQSVLQTIRSRCQVLTCTEATARHEGSYELLEMIAQVARGIDNRTLLAYAQRFVELSEEGIDELKDAQAADEAASADYLAAGARKALTEKHKREVSMQQRAKLLESLSAWRGWLRDCLLSAGGAPELAVSNTLLPAVDTPAVLQALKAVDMAEERISYNVTPKLAIEACLIEIREALCRQ